MPARTLWPGVETAAGVVYFGQRTLDAADIAAKSITLIPALAAVGQLQLTVRGGVTVAVDIDYSTPDVNTVSWAGLALDGVLEAGDMLFLVYQT